MNKNDYHFEQLNPHACKTYLVQEVGSKLGALIDPVIDHVHDYIDIIKKQNIDLKYIIDTHTHADHISGAAALSDMTDADVIMGTNAPSKCVSIRASDGQTIKLGELPMKFITTPGHTIDSLSVVLPGKILTGDVLFLDDGGGGRDDLPGGNPAMHWDSLEKIRSLDSDLIVFPAHDYRNRDPSPLSKQYKTNPHMKLRKKDEFINYINDLKLGPADWMKDVLIANYKCARDPNAAWIPVDSPACEVKGTIEKGVNDQIADFISPTELKKILSKESPPLMIDVREPRELKDKLGALENIQNVPLIKFINSLQDWTEKIDEPIILICRSGGRASTAAKIMKQAGFSNPVVLEGGMIGWRSQFGF